MLSTVVDAPVVLNIPPINIGASWRNFRLDFYKDKELTQPYNLVGLPLKSQINYPGTDIRYDVEIGQGDTAKQLVFGLPYTVTAKLTPGLVNWDVFVADAGGIDVIAIGAILIESRATQWATGGTAAQPVVVPITGTLAEHEAKVDPHPQYRRDLADYILTYGDIPTFPLGLIKGVIGEIRVNVLEAFNDPVASFSIGDTTDPKRLLGNSQIVLDQLGIASVNPSVDLGTTGAQINAYISAGQSTTGKLKIVIYEG